MNVSLDLALIDLLRRTVHPFANGLLLPNKKYLNIFRQYRKYTCNVYRIKKGKTFFRYKMVVANISMITTLGISTKFQKTFKNYLCKKYRFILYKSLQANPNLVSEPTLLIFHLCMVKIMVIDEAQLMKGLA